MAERRTALLATQALLLVTACWGSTFFLIKDLLDRVPVLDFLAVRFAIATLALALMFPRAFGSLDRRARGHAVVLGLLYGCAQILQTAGLGHTSASVGGFITGMYVVATPLFAGMPTVLIHWPEASYMPHVAITLSTCVQTHVGTTCSPVTGLRPPAASVIAMTARSRTSTSSAHCRV